MNEYPDEFLALLHSVTAKRPKTVIEHILKHGYVTSQELQDIYGYHHPPRAIRDVREQGIPIITYRITDTNGKSIAAYKFGSPEDVQKMHSKSSGRTALSKALKNALLEKYGSKCFIYLEEMDISQLQVDHRIPYEIGGEMDETQTDCFMLLSPSANRTKSWTCEHCENWQKKEKEFCMHCFWAYPEHYEHIAGRYEKIIHLIFSENEMEDYQKLISLSGETSAQEIIKKIIHEYLKSY